MRIAKLIDLTGKKFGRLTVIEKGSVNPNGNTYWVCKCDCGEIRNVRSYALRRKEEVSCGCYRRELFKETAVKHGKSNTRIYSIFGNMKMRCYNENDVNFRNYGGRGIGITSEWLDNFANFYNWSMENGYRDNLTIERIDSNKGYEPSNCRWATMKEQANNRRSNHLVTFNGKTKNIQEWANLLGFEYATLWTRLKRGWSIERTLTTPIRNSRKINV